MPLTRLSGGDLGVKAAGGGGAQVNIIVNNNAPNTQANAETQPNGDILVTIDQLRRRLIRAADYYTRRSMPAAELQRGKE